MDGPRRRMLRSTQVGKPDDSMRTATKGDAGPGGCTRWRLFIISAASSEASGSGILSAVSSGMPSRGVDLEPDGAGATVAQRCENAPDGARRWTRATLHRC
jgi:hypothetical protein